MRSSFLRPLPALPLVLLALLASLPADGAAPPPQGGKAKYKHTNRLARESSPYLLQHAHNPVDWYPWGPEAFARAKKEGKLVFLSIGYSSCHWCHVMEKESFANEEVARILNKNFVCIKVDREERPDIDQIYMTALHVQGNRGGWPLSMWLTADGRPIVGGTYWPREDTEVDGESVRGFKSLLGIILDFHKKKPEQLEETADKLAKATREALAGAVRGAALVPLDRSLVEEAAKELQEEFDPVHGGFGNPTRKFAGTKFPTPPYLLFLQGEAERTKSKELAHVVEFTLDRMAMGGIYDHVGGGFHRYSTERTWTVPHFEKMLYDNAQLLEVYARAYRTTKKPAYARVLRQTIDFVARELTAPQGGFYSALDADSEGEEGRFYVWTTKELNDALKGVKDADLFRKTYGVDKGPNFEKKYHILRLDRTPAQTAKDLGMSEAEVEARLAPVRKVLFQVRARRERPFLDTKVLTSWNGQMIAGLARAGAALDDREVVARAAKAADFVLKNLRTKEGRLLRSWAGAPGAKAEAKLNGYLDDYAFLVHGLLALHDVTGEKRWLEEAKALTDVMIEFHGDATRGGFYYTSSDHEKLFARGKDQYDGAQPSGNSMAAHNLVRLWQKTGEKRYRDEAEKSLKAFAGPMKLSASALTGMAEALALYLEEKAKK